MKSNLSGIKLVSLAIGLLAGASITAQEHSSHVLRDAVEGKIKPAQITVGTAVDGTPIRKTLPFFSTGPLKAVEAALRFGLDRGEGALGDTGPNASASVAGEAPNTIGCSDRTSNGNVRVNQDCSYRRQAEEKIVYNPANPNNLVAGQNDSRLGFNQCGIDWSIDDGVHWGDLLPPFRQKLNDPESETATAADPNSHTIYAGAGTFHTYDAGSDPAPAFDSRGRAFFTCLAFDINTNAAMVYATQSPIEAQGSFFYNITGRQFVVDEEIDPRASLDKPFIVADTFKQSPNRDNVYATWTVFNFTCNPGGVNYCSSDIFASMSTDHGLTWSTPENIGGSSALCVEGNLFDPTRSPSACDFDQGSDPAPLPNGNLVVIYNNGNTPGINGQQLGVICHPSGSSPAGTAHLNCGSPVKVGDDIAVGEPQCDQGLCIPGAYIRTNDFPRIAVDPVNGHLFAAWQDYRNQEYDIQIVSSKDGGKTWSASNTVNPDSGFDHYFPAIAVSPSSEHGRVGVSYFRTAQIPNENTPVSGGFAPGMPGVQQENSDYVLAGGRGTHTPFNFKVLSPEFPPPDGAQIFFNGDYSGLVINKENEAHPIWSDTRNPNPFPLNAVVHDEDVFTMTVELP